MIESPGCSIREADLRCEDDCRAVVDLLDMYARDPMGDGQPLRAEVRRDLPQRLAEQPQALILLAEVGQSPAGIAVCFTGFSTFAARRLINIHDLAVAPQFRGQGVGRRLLEAVEQHAMRRGCCAITLEVRGDNRAARQLYRRFGFVGGGDATGDQSYAFWKKPLASDA